MANIKSQKKRILVNERNRQAHAAEKSEMRTAIKKVKKAIDAKDVAAAEALLPKAVSLIDKAVKDGVLKQNTASRNKSSLMSSIHALKQADKADQKAEEAAVSEATK